MKIPFETLLGFIIPAVLLGFAHGMLFQRRLRESRVKIDGIPGPVRRAKERLERRKAEQAGRPEREAEEFPDVIEAVSYGVLEDDLIEMR